MKEMLERQPPPRNVPNFEVEKLLLVATSPWVIVPLIVFCFPLAILLVWLSPVRSMKSKGIWTLCICASLVIPITYGHVKKRELRSQYAEANRLWDEGRKGEAAPKYLNILNKDINAVMDNFEFLGPEAAPLVYGRVIDHYAEGGDVEAARRYISLARKKNVVPTVESREGRILLRGP